MSLGEFGQTKAGAQCHGCGEDIRAVVWTMASTIIIVLTILARGVGGAVATLPNVAFGGNVVLVV